MFKKLLIANRGEIACRIARTAKRMGIKTVAIHSDIDRHALHVQACDESISLGGAKATESYLNADRIISEAKSIGVHAIHPGYGFLSENTGFAAQCENAGITFIGPSSESIKLMGSKSAARAAMIKANVPVVPGYEGDNQEEHTLLREANKIGYPLLIKASAGGGGKGMRVVENADEFGSALDAVKRESASAFGDDRVILEKYLATARHIEVQVFGDSYGNVVHLFERDCSLQRRNQKVIEESPATGMDDILRREMTDAAIACAKSISYLGAGTIEFLLAPDRQFFFMEMNTRLQVEHPVTEMITGQDLVEWQIRIANGESLPLSQDEIQISGHAVEARIYAENPSQGFLPATGKLMYLERPEGEHVRVDSGVTQGDEISIYYDPMIAKLICWADSRESAFNKLISALENYPILGLENNVSFLANLAKSENVRKGSYSTRFIEDNQNELIPTRENDLEYALEMAALVILESHDSHSWIPGHARYDYNQKGHAGYRIGVRHRPDSASTIKSNINSPWLTRDLWTNGLNRAQIFSLNYANQSYDVTVANSYNSLLINDLIVINHCCNENTLEVETETGKSSIIYARQGNSIYLLYQNQGYHFVVIDRRIADSTQIASEASFKAPMPGSVVAVKTAKGSKVNTGDTLMIIEAMKMEHQIKAPKDGVVETVRFNAGDQVKEGDVLLELK